MGKSRKAKIQKAKKIRREARRVCLHIITRPNTQTHSSSQAKPARFLYSNNEITKRRDPVGVNVWSPHPFFVCTYDRHQDVRDLVLHIIADAPPPSWIRLQVSLPVWLLRSYVLMFPEPAHRPKTSCPPSSWTYVYCAFTSPPAHLRH
jgi:hypothetical protein